MDDPNRGVCRPNVEDETCIPSMSQGAGVEVIVALSTETYQHRSIGRA